MQKPFSLCVERVFDSKNKIHEQRRLWIKKNLVKTKSVGVVSVAKICFQSKEVFFFIKKLKILKVSSAIKKTASKYDEIFSLTKSDGKVYSFANLRIWSTVQELLRTLVIGFHSPYSLI